MKASPTRKRWVTRWLRFSGRSSRAEFFGLLAIMLTLTMLAIGCDLWLLGDTGRARYPATTGAIVLLLFTLPAGACRRLHDRNRRGGWLLLPLIAGLAFAGLALNAPDVDTIASGTLWALALAMDALALLTAMSTLWLAVLLLRRGLPEPNRFGSPPGVAKTKENAS